MPVHAGSTVDVLAFDYAAGSHEQLHVHPHEALLIHAEAGEYRVFTEDRMWALLPGRAIWLPPGVASGLQAGSRATVRLRPLHFPLPLPEMLPAEPTVVPVSALLVAVIGELHALPADDAICAALRQVALHEIRKTEPVLLPSLPQPRHAGLRRVAARQLDELAAEWTLQACAEVAHLSVRTFCRVFPKEAAGLTWPAWVRQARMMVGRQLLELGASVNQAAAQVGYDSQSAFAAAYRRIHGVSPSSHVKGLAARS